MAVYNITGNSTITDIISGIYQGSGNVTTAKRIQGGSFGASLTIKSVPTNTSASRHSGGFAGTSMEFTNTGLVEFADGATGMMTGIKGPSSTIEAPAFGSTSNIWEDSSTAGHFLLLRFGSTTVAGGVGSTAYSGTREDNNNPYYTTSGRTWELRENDDVFYERGANEGGDNYAIIKHTCKVVNVRAGGTTLSIAADNGTNFTDNILRTEEPFTVNVVYPTGGIGRIKYGSTVSSATSLDEGALDRGDSYEITWYKKGSKIFYATGTIENIPENGTQTITAVDTAEAYPTGADDSGVTSVTVTFNSSNELVVDMANIEQDNLVMNKVMTEAIMGSTETYECIFYNQSANIYRSAGPASGSFIDPVAIKVTSSTAKASPLNKETFPFYDIIGATTDIYELTDLDDYLGQNTLRPGLNAIDVAQAILPMFKRTSRLKPVNNTTDE